MNLYHAAMFFLANPSIIDGGNYISSNATELFEFQKVAVLVGISILEGIVLGLILSVWAKPTYVNIMVGILINLTTLSLFWTNLLKDPSEISIILGEIAVTCAETILICGFLTLQTKDPLEKYLGVGFMASLTLNIFSYLIGYIFIHV